MPEMNDAAGHYYNTVGRSQIVVLSAHLRHSDRRWALAITLGMLSWESN